MKKIYPLRERGLIRVEDLLKPRNPKRLFTVKCVRPKGRIDLESALQNEGRLQGRKTKLNFSKWYLKPVPSL
jgi:hypothetical protein